jgi:hypothetical protein
VSIKITGNIVCTGNGGDGIRIEGDVDVDIQADELNVSGNGGHGINVIKHAGIMQQFGLPKETDPKELCDLLTKLLSAQHQDKPSVIKESSLFSKFSIGALNTTTLISNLINISNNPQVLQIIATLAK